jgi:hypothetical protein
MSVALHWRRAPRRARLIFLGFALPLGACALCERPRPVPPPVQPIKFYPAQPASYDGSYQAAPVGYESGYDFVALRLEESPVGSAKTLNALSVDERMDRCMASWSTSTHIARSRWRQICARTMDIPHR